MGKKTLKSNRCVKLLCECLLVTPRVMIFFSSKNNRKNITKRNNNTEKICTQWNAFYVYKYQSYTRIKMLCLPHNPNIYVCYKYVYFHSAKLMYINYIKKMQTDFIMHEFSCYMYYYYFFYNIIKLLYKLLLIVSRQQYDELLALFSSFIF